VESDDGTVLRIDDEEVVITTATTPARWSTVTSLCVRDFTNCSSSIFKAKAERHCKWSGQLRGRN
jgi:hypothetical protein